jgi:acetyl/propionyl-CoA carboxylase alpha subunit
MYHATVNDRTFEIEPADFSFLVDGTELRWDLSTVGDGSFHLIVKGRSYGLELVEADALSKVITLKINGQVYAVTVKDPFDMLLEKMGLHQPAAPKVNVVKAPMPGLIIDLKVQAGDVVKAGDPLLILEAMKMENILKSPGEGVIKLVKVKKGENVEKGAVLIEF